MAQIPRYDDTQATNPFSSGEIRQRLGQAADSGATNPFTTQELRDRLPSPENHDPGQVAAAAHSGATNPFTSEEIRDRLTDSGKPDSGQDAPEPAVVKPSAAARLFLKSVQPAITARLLEGNPRNFQLDFKAPLPGEHVLAVAQEPDRIHVGIAVSGSEHSNPSPKALAALYFDPESDIIILENVGPAVFGIAPEGAAMGPSHFVAAARLHAISPGTWSLHVKSGSSWTHVIQMTVTRRDFFAFESNEDGSGRKRGGPESGAKRAIHEGGGGGHGQAATKRQRSGRDDASVDIILRAPESRVSATSAGHKAQSSTAIQLGNPLLQLKDGGTVAIGDGMGGSVYTLTKAHRIFETEASAVFKAAKSDVPGKFVAVKVFRIRANPVTGEKTGPTHYAAIAIACRAMAREIKIHKGLKHDRIVELYSVDSRVMALYLEYVEGPSLMSERWCSRQGWKFQGNTEDAQRILTDTARGLQFLHSKGIVHNDLKPANLLYSRERGAVICDLGLASLMQQTRDCGTPWYVAPENTKAHHLRVGADDCWSLGVVGLYALKETKLPEKATEMWKIAQIHLNIQPNRAADLATAWYDKVKDIEMKLRESVQGGGHAGSREDASRDQLVQCVVRLIDRDPARRPTPSGVLEMLQGPRKIEYSE